MWILSRIKSWGPNWAIGSTWCKLTKLKTLSVFERNNSDYSLVLLSPHCSVHEINKMESAIQKTIEGFDTTDEATRRKLIVTLNRMAESLEESNDTIHRVGYLVDTPKSPPLTSIHKLSECIASANCHCESWFRNWSLSVSFESQCTAFCRSDLQFHRCTRSASEALLELSCLYRLRVTN